MDKKMPILGLAVAFLVGWNVASRAGDALDAVSAGDGASGGWRISAGVGYRTVRGVTFQTGMRSAPYSDSVSGAGAQVGSATECVSRQYDNGYIDMENGLGGNETLAWACEFNNVLYDCNSHIRSGGEEITFYAANGYWTSWHTLSSMPDAWQDTDQATTTYSLSATRICAGNRRWRVSVDTDVSYLTLSASKTLNGVYQRSVYESTIADTYYVSDGIVHSDPGPVHNGPSVGHPLNGTPITREEILTKVCEDVWTKTVSESLESDVFTFSLGLAAEYGISRLGLTAGAGPSLTFVHSDAERWETDEYRQQTWHDVSSGNEWAAGCYGKVGVTLQLTDRLQTGILGRYDWIEKIAGAVGPSTYEIDLDGFSLVAAATVGF